MSDIIGFWPTDVVDAHTTLQESPDGTLNLFRSRARKVISTWIKASTHKTNLSFLEVSLLQKAKEKVHGPFETHCRTVVVKFFQAFIPFQKGIVGKANWACPRTSLSCNVHMCVSCLFVVHVCELCVCVCELCVCVCVCVCACVVEREKKEHYSWAMEYSREEERLCVWCRKNILGNGTRERGDDLLLLLLLCENKRLFQALGLVVFFRHMNRRLWITSHAGFTKLLAKESLGFF